MSHGRLQGRERQRDPAVRQMAQQARPYHKPALLPPRRPPNLAVEAAQLSCDRRVCGKAGADFELLTSLTYRAL